MMRAPRTQRGVTLLISMIMLLVLTLFAAAMIRLSNTNVVVVGNMQTQHALVSAARQAIETDMNSASFYNDQINSTGTWASGSTSVSNIDNYKVTLNEPKCIYTTKAAGYSAISNVAPDDDYFEVSAQATDPTDSNAGQVTMVQGVKVTLPTGNCVGP